MSPQKREELKELLNDPRTGLKDSSDTNKTRYAILALFEEVYQELQADRENIKEYMISYLNSERFEDRDRHLIRGFIEVFYQIIKSKYENKKSR